MAVLALWTVSSGHFLQLLLASCFDLKDKLKHFGWHGFQVLKRQNLTVPKTKLGQIMKNQNMSKCKNYANLMTPWLYKECAADKSMVFSCPGSSIIEIYLEHVTFSCQLGFFHLKIHSRRVKAWTKQNKTKHYMCGVRS